jgi:hypothetical protein
MAQFLAKGVQIGLVGDVYDQLTADGGAGHRVGPFRSRVFGWGRNSATFPAGDYQGFR